MTIYRGLNVQKAMNDVDNKSQSLINLGLDQRDLALISGVNALGVVRNEMKTLAGLVDDQKKALYALGEASETMAGQLNSLSDIQVPQAYNIEYDDQVRASAIKYNYLDFAQYGTSTESQSADISTSRVSSWSSIGNTILYGGEIKVTGDKIQLSSLKSTSAPVVKLFRSEIPTHTLTIKVNNSDQKFLAMKGIPMELEGFFRNANLYHGVTPVNDTHPDTGATNSQVPATWRIVNNDNGSTYNSGDGTIANPGNRGVGSAASPSVWPFRDSSSRSRKVQFYYDPSKILNLGTTSLNLTSWTTSKLPALVRLNISSNDLYVLPSFRSDASTKDGALTPGGLAPVLQYIDISKNNLSRARDDSGAQIVATHQLNTLPTTLKSLTMNGCFSDGTTIDLLDYTELTVLNFDSLYARNARRAMTGGTVTPKTHTNTSANKGIVNYYISHQPYSQLANGVCTSLKLNNLTLYWTGVATKEGGGDITLDSQVITRFISHGNNHNVINMNNRTSLKYYDQYHNRSIASPGNAIGTKFNGCANLTYLRFLYSNVTGDIGGLFGGLTNLTSLDIRLTNLSGSLIDSSFSGTEKLQSFYAGWSSHVTSDFFGTTASSANGEVFVSTPDLVNLYVYNNGNIAGLLPDFSFNTKLRTVYFHGTNLNGPIPTFSNSQSISYFRCSNCNFSGTIPGYTGNSWDTIYAYGNSFSGQVPALTTPYLRILELHYNNLSGNVPDLSGCTRLQRFLIYNNNLTGYISGSLKYNTSLSTIDLSNNSLNSSAGTDIINDLFENYALNPRRGVSVNLLGNVTTGLTRQNINNDGTDGITADRLTFLEQRWTIAI